MHYLSHPAITLKTQFFSASAVQYFSFICKQSFKTTAMVLSWPIVSWKCLSKLRPLFLKRESTQALHFKFSLKRIQEISTWISVLIHQHSRKQYAQNKIMQKTLYHAVPHSTLVTAFYFSVLSQLRRKLRLWNRLKAGLDETSQGWQITAQVLKEVSGYVANGPFFIIVNVSLQC